jgi:hypothetical protein
MLSFGKKNIFPYILKPRGYFILIPATIKYKNKYWFLIMEVANFKYNWFWIDSLDIYDTMTIIDSDTNKYRSLVIIKE